MIAVVGNALYEPRVGRVSAESAVCPQKSCTGSCWVPCSGVAKRNVDRALEKKWVKCGRLGLAMTRLPNRTHFVAILQTNTTRPA